MMHGQKNIESGT